MIKKQKNSRKKNSSEKILFNASVVLAGINSPSGGSAKVLSLARSGKIPGVISEIILDEILRHADKFDLSRQAVDEYCRKTFTKLFPPPTAKIVRRYKGIVIDEGDTHILATCEEEGIKYLVTLDKKHLLILKGKIKGLNILTPGELIEIHSKK